jgi:GcrA cell cycle regulator
MSEWTAERTQRLRDDWAAGLPGSAIAARLDVTRATIMGKVRRLKLATRKEQAKTGRPPRAPEQAPPIPPHLTPPTIWKTFVGLGPGECRWPFGDRHFVFCARTADGGQPYCAAHSRVAYQPSRVREAA